jgi:uncharacterized protein (TIGR03083 family)
LAETPAFLAGRLQAEGEKVRQFFSTLSDEQWQRSIYTEGAEWRVRDVLAHFVSSERSLLKLFQNIYAGGGGASEDFSIDRFNRSQVAKLQSFSPEQLLDDFGDVRRGMIDWVWGLAEADLSKTGRHPFLGVTTLAEMIKMIYRHNQIHYRDLRRVLRD